MAFNTNTAYMLRDNNGKWQKMPIEVMIALKEIGLTVVFVSGEIGCYGEYCGKNDTMCQKLSSEMIRCDQ